MPLKMRSEPGPGGELGRPRRVAWETAEQKQRLHMAAGLPKDRRLAVPEVPLWAATASVYFTGVSHTPMRQTEKLRWGEVEGPTRCHSEGQWLGQTEPRAGACLPALGPAHLLELQPRSTQPGGVLASEARPPRCPPWEALRPC